MPSDAPQREWDAVFESIAKRSIQSRAAVTVYTGTARRFVELMRVARWVDGSVAV